MRRGGSRSARLIPVLVAAAALVAGCATTVATENVGPCSPSYEISQPGAARIAIQQAGRGTPIQWGVYEEAQYKVGTRFVVKVLAGGVTIDGKNQAYEPHGSVSVARALKYSGQRLEINGTATHGRDQLFFSAKCTIA